MPGAEDNYQSYGIPWANVSNTPFRYYKHWVHEGGISSPLVAHWPAGITLRGAWTDEVGHLIDILATCADVGQASYPQEHAGNVITPLEGKSLAPVFRNEDADGHPEGLYWEHEGNRAIRVGDWKLVSKFSAPERGRWELYNLKQDRSELNDLAEGPCLNGSPRCRLNIRNGLIGSASSNGARGTADPVGGPSPGWRTEDARHWDLRSVRRR